MLVEAGGAAKEEAKDEVEEADCAAPKDEDEPAAAESTSLPSSVVVKTGVAAGVAGSLPTSGAMATELAAADPWFDEGVLMGFALGVLFCVLLCQLWRLWRDRREAQHATVWIAPSVADAPTAEDRPGGKDELSSLREPLMASSSDSTLRQRRPMTREEFADAQAEANANHADYDDDPNYRFGRGTRRGPPIACWVDVPETSTYTRRLEVSRLQQVQLPTGQKLRRVRGGARSDQPMEQVPARE